MAEAAVRSDLRPPEYGEPAPFFEAATDAVPNYNFGVAAGRWIVLMVFGTLSLEASREASGFWLAYGDASALVKLYADEIDSDAVRGVPMFAVAQVSRVEVPAALGRKDRMGGLTPRLTAALIADFEADVAALRAEEGRDDQ